MSSSLRAAAIASSTGCAGRQPGFLDGVGIQIGAIEVAELARGCCPRGRPPAGLRGSRAPAAASARAGWRTSPSGPDPAGSARCRPSGRWHSARSHRRASRWDRRPTDRGRRRRSARARRGCGVACRLRAQARPPRRECHRPATAMQHGNGTQPSPFYAMLGMKFLRVPSFRRAPGCPCEQQPGGDPRESAQRVSAAPSARGAPRASAYRLPENNTTPATQQRARRGAARHRPSVRSARPTPISPSAWKNW